jgi:hypothetical protein
MTALALVKYNHPKDFACDGVLYYAKYLKAKFNVIAIGVSGTDRSDHAHRFLSTGRKD